jgi:Fe-S oxidoreductase
MREIAARCTACGACVKACPFLARYGTPRALAEGFDPARPESRAIAYRCSLCGLCNALCPERVEPQRLFLHMRRRAVATGYFTPLRYLRILGYERLGMSQMLAWSGLPPGCDTVLFPGCSLPGTRPLTTLRMFRHLQAQIPSLGIVLDCCGKPSHDLGRREWFERRFGRLAARLRQGGVRRVLLACPSCYAVFRDYGRGLAARMVYDWLAEAGAPAGAHAGAGAVCVHDSCALREELAVQRALRRLLGGMGLAAVEMAHRGRFTLCCGEGGMVAALDPGLARGWTAMRVGEAEGLPLVTSCAGCAAFLGRQAPALHIADLLYRPEALRDGRPAAAGPPLTYLNRLRLKGRLKHALTKPSG